MFLSSAPPRGWRWLAGAVLAGLLLAALGPFGSYMNGGPVERAGYWIAAVLLGVLLYGAAFRLATRIAPAGTSLRWPVLVGATLLASIPEALATRAAAFWLWPELTRLPLPWPLWFAQTLTLGLVAMAVAAAIRHFAALRPDAPAAPRPEPAPAPVALLAGDVVALQMEDHYVRVHRQTGSELLLMPLARAIEAVDGEGLRTHRSWWVARRAVASVEGTPRSMRLMLSNGTVAPVARSAVIHLKAAGWI